MREENRKRTYKTFKIGEHTQEKKRQNVKHRCKTEAQTKQNDPERTKNTDGEETKRIERETR